MGPTGISLILNILKDGGTFIFGQLLIREAGHGFSLCHHLDAGLAPLADIPRESVREWVQFSEGGAFRPLKSAPNLRRGWKVELRDATELEQILNQIYPGSVADFFWAQQDPVPITDYRNFTARQTGMYRITAALEDGPAKLMVRACCHPRQCLKQRLWTVANLEGDSPQSKSLIPCLEPCAILLEFARKTARLEQEPRLELKLGASETATLRRALENALSQPLNQVPEADFSDPGNPRRLQMLLEKLTWAAVIIPPNEE